MTTTTTTTLRVKLFLGKIDQDLYLATIRTTGDTLYLMGSDLTGIIHVILGATWQHDKGHHYRSSFFQSSKILNFNFRAIANFENFLKSLPYLKCPSLEQSHNI